MPFPIEKSVFSTLSFVKQLTRYTIPRKTLTRHTLYTPYNLKLSSGCESDHRMKHIISHYLERYPCGIWPMFLTTNNCLTLIVFFLKTDSCTTVHYVYISNTCAPNTTNHCIWFQKKDQSYHILDQQLL